MNGLPKILARRDEAELIVLDIDVNRDNPWFAGHFPEMAVLPGVVQIGWAAHFGHALQGLGPGVNLLEQVKFKRPILPGARLTLTLKIDLTTRKLRYEYKDEEHSYSSGVLQFEPGP
jgi:3-hydroxymyristoyl/3-hydroxydecanoyl-(acyl carrier protein) dehydratase